MVCSRITVRITISTRMQFAISLSRFVVCLTVSILSEVGVNSACDLKWTHACNSAKAVEESCRSGAHLVETDLIFYEKTSSVLIAHAKQDIDNEPHLRLARQMPKWFQHFFSRPRVLGLKLDFKSPASVQPCLNELKTHWADQCEKRPIWLNADVLGGPRILPNALKFQGQDVDDFIELGKQVPGAVISLGWKTSDPPFGPTVNRTYTPETEVDIYLTGEGYIRNSLWLIITLCA